MVLDYVKDYGHSLEVTGYLIQMIKKEILSKHLKELSDVLHEENSLRQSVERPGHQEVLGLKDHLGSF